MAALREAYKEAGAGKLFWCGYGENASPTVQSLIKSICAGCNGRKAYYIATDGFDSTLYSIARYCMSNDKEFLQKLDDIKKQLSVNIKVENSSFALPSFPLNKIVNTNAYPISFPKQCYQFELNLNPKESNWEYCKHLYKSGVMAIPYKGMIYAWGDIKQIHDICRDKLKSKVELCPLTRETIMNISVYKELLLKTVTRILAEKIILSVQKIKYGMRKK